MISFLDYRMGVCTDDIGGLYKKDKCCCTKFGEAWGFGCAQCPKPGTLSFDELCPKGYGFVDTVDVNECLAFPDMCQNGRCKNTLGDFECRCNQGRISERMTYEESKKWFEFPDFLHRS